MFQTMGASQEVNRSLRRGARLALLAVALIVATVFVALALEIKAIHDGSVHRRQFTLAVGTTATAQSTVLVLESALRGYLLTGRPEFVVAYRQAAGALPGQLARLRSQVREDRRQAQAVDALSGSIAAYRDTYARPLLSAAERRQRVEPAEIERGQTLLDGLRAQFARELALADGRRRMGNQTTSASIQRVLLIAGGGVLLTVLLLGALACFLGRSILNPVSAVSRVAARRRAGEKRRVRLRAQSRGDRAAGAGVQ